MVMKVNVLKRNTTSNDQGSIYKGKIMVMRVIISQMKTRNIKDFFFAKVNYTLRLGK